MASIAQKRRVEAEGDKCESEDVGKETIIDVTTEVEDDINILHEQAIICKFFKLRASKEEIKKWIKDEWRADVIIKFLSKQFFITIFTYGANKLTVVNAGLWQMKGAPLYIQQWYENFDPSKLHPTNHPVWIRLYNLPLLYWAKDCLVKIG
ncbi:hypothetical protein SUGI_0179530 [Cryptomeria japonica]|nr:hypothetical protein SUGI_0179530 [Cryptomeria japonica]